MFPFNSQRNHHLREVAKSLVNPFESLLDFFEPLFVIDNLFSTRNVISQIEVKILVVMPILVQQKVCFKTKQNKTL